MGISNRHMRNALLDDVVGYILRDLLKHCDNWGMVYKRARRWFKA